MSGMTSDPNPVAAAAGAAGAPPAVKASWWKTTWQKIAGAYRRRPLLCGFFTLLGLTLLVAGLSPLVSSSPGGPRSSFGRQETAASRLRGIADSLRRMDEFGQMPYTQMLRDTLNPWMREHKPQGAWEPDNYLFAIFPQFQIADYRRQELAQSIAELEKRLQPGDGKAPAPRPLEAVKKDGAALVQARTELQRLEQQMGQVRSQLIQELSTLTFSLDDVFIIEGKAWLRDVSNRLRERLARRSRGAVDSLALAQELFDWTVRHVTLEENVDLEKKEQRKAPLWEELWESLLWGRGPAETRAWIFIELCRQQEIDAVMLGYRVPDPEKKLEVKYAFWIPAVVLSRGQAAPGLYLFDHRWGVPIPGPGGQGVATLTQAAASGEILAQLDGTYQYPVRSSQLQDVVAMVDISPHLVARRMQVLEDELRGVDRLVLTVELGKLAARLQKMAGIQRVEAWPWPFDCERYARIVPWETRVARLSPFAMKGVEEKGRKNETLRKEARFKELAYRDPEPVPQEGDISLELQKRGKREQEVSGFLWRGRMLHFQGIFTDADDQRKAASGEQSPPGASRKGAPNVYQSGRISDRDLEEMNQELQTDLKTLEKKRQERRSLEEIAMLDRAISGANALLDDMPAVRLHRRFVRLIATGWVGQVAYERGDYADAAAYFRHLLDADAKSLEESLKAIPEKPSTPADKQLRQNADETIKPMLAAWKSGANYNLARALEAAGRYDEAKTAYNNDRSEQRPGSLYRARLIERRQAPRPAEAKEPPAAKKESSPVNSTK